MGTILNECYSKLDLLWLVTMIYYDYCDYYYTIYLLWLVN